MLRGMSERPLATCRHAACRRPFACPSRPFGAGRRPLYCSAACKLAAARERADARRKAAPPPPAEPEPPAPVAPPANPDPLTANRLYDADEAAFLRAADAYRRASRRPFLTAIDYLSVAISLGYRKPAPPHAPAQANAGEMLGAA